MKLAEALADRSDYQIRIEEMKKRLIRSGRVQEGDQPAEDTIELLAEAFARMLELVSGINRTNSKSTFDKERSISDAIAVRAALIAKDYVSMAAAIRLRPHRSFAAVEWISLPHIAPPKSQSVPRAI